MKKKNSILPYFPFHHKFNRRIKLEFHGAKVTSDAGLLLYRELDEVFGLTAIGNGNLVEERTGKNIQHTRTALLRQSVFSRLAGNKDTNDAERLRSDPVMRQIVGGRTDWQLAASTSEMSRFETQMLTKPENLTALMDMSGQWIERVNSRVGMKKLILDMDSSESPTYGKQEGSAFNVHFGCTCYHPCSVSTSLAIWNGPTCVKVTCTVLTIGCRCSNRSLPAIASVP